MQSEVLVVHAEPKVVQVFGSTMKGVTFEHSDLIARYADLYDRGVLQEARFSP